MKVLVLRSMLLLCTITLSLHCSLQEKIDTAASKIALFRQQMKNGTITTDNLAKCGGSKCCGNSCGRCGKEHCKKAIPTCSK